MQERLTGAINTPTNSLPEGNRESSELQKTENETLKTFSEVLDKFSCLKIGVWGIPTLEQETYIESSGRFCKEGPIPLYTTRGRIIKLGAAGNLVANLRSMGASVEFLSVIGDDLEGQMLLGTLQRMDVPTENILISNCRSSLFKERTYENNLQVRRTDSGRRKKLTPDEEDFVISRLETLFSTCNAVVISDYNFGMDTPRIVQKIKELQEKYKTILVADSKKIVRYKNVGLTAIKPNYKEAAAFLGINPDPDPTKLAERRETIIKEHGERLVKRLGADMVAVSLDCEGSILFQDESFDPYHTYATSRPNSMAIGAGDTFVSALTLSLAAGAIPEIATEIGSMASSLVLKNSLVETCSIEQLRSKIESFRDKLIEKSSDAKDQLEKVRKTNYTVFLTAAVDDLEKSLREINIARALGDNLVVGVRMEKPGYEKAAELFSSLSSVSNVVYYCGEVPPFLIDSINPDLVIENSIADEEPVLYLRQNRRYGRISIPDFSQLSQIDSPASLKETEKPSDLVRVGVLNRYFPRRMMPQSEKVLRQETLETFLASRIQTTDHLVVEEKKHESELKREYVEEDTRLMREKARKEFAEILGLALYKIAEDVSLGLEEPKRKIRAKRIIRMLRLIEPLATKRVNEEALYKLIMETAKEMSIDEILAEWNQKAEHLRTSNITENEMNILIRGKQLMNRNGSLNPGQD